MNKDFKAILDSLKESKQETLTRDSRVLLIDSLNTFLRSFVMINHMNPAGNHIGGLTGFLKSVGFAIRHIKPTRVIFVFDGHGGSTNKRYLYPEYKANRKINKISNWEGFETQQDESDAITNQIVRLVDYLKCLPVDLISIDKIEADDVIGYMTGKIEGTVHIMSSDKDYLQLVSDRVTVYSPTKKKFYTPKMIKEEFDIHPCNFLTHKVLVGDTGDNVPGVKGIGMKTLLKLYPALKQDTRVSVEEIIAHAGETKGSYEKIYNYRNQLLINHKLMDLEDPNIPEENKETIQALLDTPNSTMDKATFLQYYNEDSLQNSITNVAVWIYDTFDYLRHFETK
jgi:DNA polymerase-1